MEGGLERRDEKHGKNILGVTEQLMFVFGLHFEGSNKGRVSGCERPVKAREGASEEAQMIRGNADKRKHFGDVMQAIEWQDESSAHTCSGEVCTVKLFVRREKNLICLNSTICGVIALLPVGFI